MRKLQGVTPISLHPLRYIAWGLRIILEQLVFRAKHACLHVLKFKAKPSFMMCLELYSSHEGAAQKRLTDEIHQVLSNKKKGLQFKVRLF